MSYNWALYSFDYESLQRALIHSRRKIVDAVIDEMREYREDPRVIDRHLRVGNRLAASGVAYDGWSKPDLKIVDRFVFNLFHTCADELKIEPESPHFLSPSVTCELPGILEKRSFWSRPTPIPLEKREYACLPFFTHHGRRLGEAAPSFCEYIAFNPDETQTLKGEIEKFLASPEGRELDARYPDTLRPDLLAPVVTTLRKGKSLHARLS